VKHISSDSYEEIRDVLRDFFENVIHDSGIRTKDARRKIVTYLDVAYARKSQGSRLSGFSVSVFDEYFLLTFKVGSS
jgi:histone H3/H4